jgi:hypothetical protein
MHYLVISSGARDLAFSPAREEKDFSPESISGHNGFPA